MNKNKKELLCGVAFNRHDSSVSFAYGEKIALVLEAERVFRKKKMDCTPREMEKLILYGLNLLGNKPDDVSYWALETLRNPWLAEKDKHSNPPVWRKTELLGKERDCLVVNHHLAHASSFLFSPSEDALILTCDGGGDFGERVTLYSGKGTSIKKEGFDVSKFISAKPYDLCATYLYSKPRCEGRFMALASYGEFSTKYAEKLEKLLPELCTTDYETGDKILSDSFPGLKGTASAENKSARDFAATLQSIFVQHRINDIQKVITHYKPRNLVLSGGACLNLEVNTKVWKLYPKLSLFVPPCCDDTGESLGALAYLIAEVTGERPVVDLPYLGYGNSTYDYTQETIEELADALLRDEFLIVHNHKAEIGPRALGNRSLIARPDSIRIKDTLSQKIKEREPYRPVAPIVLEEKLNDYFEGPKQSPYMLDQYKVKPEAADKIIGAVHVDKTARAQTVNAEDNPFMYDLIKSFGKKSGVYVLLNTSLNLQGEPISNTREDTLNISRRIKQKHKVVYNGKILK